MLQIYSPTIIDNRPEWSVKEFQKSVILFKINNTKSVCGLFLV